MHSKQRPPASVTQDLRRPPSISARWMPLTRSLRRPDTSGVGQPRSRQSPALHATQRENLEAPLRGTHSSIRVQIHGILVNARLGRIGLPRPPYVSTQTPVMHESHDSSQNVRSQMMPNRWKQRNKALRYPKRPSTNLVATRGNQTPGSRYRCVRMRMTWS